MTHLFNSRSGAASSARKTRQTVDRTTTARAPEAKPRRRSAQIPSSAARRSPKQARAQGTADAIITAAEQLLVEIGYARASTNAIARRAGVSVGSLYQYFPNKEAVFRAVVLRHSSEVKPTVLRTLDGLANSRRDFVAATLELLRKLADVNAKNPRLLLAIERELGFIGHDAEAALNVASTVRVILAQRFNLSEKELEVAVSLVVETLTHLSRWLVHGKPPGLDTELFIAAMGRMLRAIVPRSKARPGRSG